MQIFILASITLINLALWVVFFIKFKSLFSTDDVVSDTRSQINSLLTDIQHQTGICIDIIDERIKQLKQVSAEADRHVALLKSEIQKASEASVLENSIQNAVQSTAKKPRSHGKTVEQKYKKNQIPEINENDTYAVNDLFSGQEDAVQSDFTVTSDGASYGQIPVVAPKVVMADKQIKRKKDFNTQVLELFDQGLSVDEIASRFSRSTTEVQLILDLR